MTINYLPFEKTEIEGSIITRWQRVVEHFPKHIAVTTVNGERYTYAELDQAANRLAHALLKALGAENCPVVLLFDHAYPLLISILGTLKAGKAYVAFDTTQPIGQLQLLYKTIAPPVMVTNTTDYALAQTIANMTEPTTLNQQSIWLLETLPEINAASPALSIAPNAVATIVFTSGTVKQPKAVARSHRIVLYCTWYALGTQPFGPGHCIAGIRHCGLGSGILYLFYALLYGATYCLYDLKIGGLQYLTEWLQRERISFFPPPIVLFRQWLETLVPGAFYPHLRYIEPSGRKTSADLEPLWPHVSDECSVHTGYAATEVDLITSALITRHTSLPEGVLHVGTPLPDRTVNIIQEDSQNVAVGEIGEIVVRSRYIPTGYWRQPELSSERFIQAGDGSGETIYRTGDFGYWRSDGNLELVGRQDSQVKLRGYRVVLEEVEDALRSLSSVQEAAVTADEERGLLYAYVIATVQPPPLASALRTALAEKLPYYALPTHIVFLPHFPLLSSGKVNRRALPTPEFNREGLTNPYVPPRTALEATLTALWEEVLAVEPIGMLDHFLELGGSSLSAMRLMVAVERRLGVQVSLATFFACPTISHQAQTFNQAEPASLVIAAAQPTDPATHTARSPEQEQAFQRIYREIGQPDAVQSWLQPQEARWQQRRKDIHALLGRLPYRLAVAWLAWSAQQRQVQGRYYRKEVTAVQQFLPMIGHTAQDRQLVADYLFFGAWEYYRLTPWGNHPEKLGATETMAWVDVRGMGLVEQAVAEGRGLLLLRSHSNGNFFFDTLSFQSYRLGQLKRHLAVWQLNDTLTQNTLLAHQLNTARQVLEKGGIVNVHADGRHGYSQGRLYNFLGRQRSFHTSFAELALLTGATVIAVDVTLHRNGRATLTFVGSFDPGAAHEAYPHRVERLVNQYVAFCQAKWANEPWLIPWNQLAWHLEAPSWEDGLPLHNES